MQVLEDMGDTPISSQEARDRLAQSLKDKNIDGVSFDADGNISVTPTK